MNNIRAYLSTGTGLLLVLLLLIFPLACTESTQITEAIELRHGTDESPTHQRYQELILPFLNKIEEVSNHQVIITPYPAESLITAEQAYDSIMTGVIDIGDCNTADNLGGFTLHEAVFMPGLGATSPGISTRTVWDLLNQFPQVQAEFADIKVFSW